MAGDPDNGDADGFRAIPFLSAMAIGTGGGAVFAWLGLPLPWMLGAMTATTIAATAGVRMSMPRWLRGGCVTVLGVMLGASFTPAVVARMAEWWITLAALFGWALASGGLGWAYFAHVARFDRVTSFFSASPGGLNEMTLVGAQLGGDERTISLVHATRVFITVFAIPFWFRFHDGLSSSASGRGYVELLSIGLDDYAILAACAVVGTIGAAKLRIPAATVIGPMFLSAAVHLAGFTESAPPTLVIFAAQVVVGSTLGCRFVGFSPVVAGRTIAHACVVGSMMIAVTVATSLLLSRVADVSIASILLGFAPGGLAEMSLVAIALAADAAFVATHHIVRIVIVVLCAPLLFRSFSTRR